MTMRPWIIAKTLQFAELLTIADEGIMFFRMVWIRFFRKKWILKKTDLKTSKLAIFNFFFNIFI